ncbi:MAG TPA: phosphate signaling complex protein PhoU [Ilumatobacteraceae bacterium]|nr:phosphate signaling complex protein PhoU [Ilumatobacteraceae bacterium]
MGELRTTFHQNLAGLSGDVTALGEQVVALIPRTTTALLAGDLADAGEVMIVDQQISKQAHELEDRAVTIIALEGPVAIDLRRLVTMMRILDEVARSANLLANVCRANRRLYGHDLDERVRRVIAAMSDQAELLYRTAIDSFVEHDGEKAAMIDEMDSILDGLQREFVQTIFDVHADDLLQLEVAIQLAVIARFYERIGDHAVNIGERIAYMVTGALPEHKGAEIYRTRGLNPSHVID